MYVILQKNNQMKKMNEIQNDEINLSELFEALWKGKLLIGTFILLGTLVGFGYAQVAQPKYNVSVKYITNIYSIHAHQTCGKQIKCLERVAKRRFLYLLEGDWGSKLSFSTSSPKHVKEYEAQLERATVMLNNKIFSEAKNEIDIIQTELSDPMISTDNIAQQMLYAKRIVKFINDGQSVISFSSVSIIKSSPKMPKILALSVILSSMIGMFIVLIRYNIKKRKQ